MSEGIRDQRGRLVRETWVAYCLETGDTKPSHIAPWDELSEWDKEADRRIGDALAAAVPSAEVLAALRAIAVGLRAWTNPKIGLPSAQAAINSAADCLPVLDTYLSAHAPGADPGPGAGAEGGSHGG